MRALPSDSQQEVLLLYLQSSLAVWQQEQPFMGLLLRSYSVGLSFRQGLLTAFRSSLTSFSAYMLLKRLRIDF